MEWSTDAAKKKLSRLRQFLNSHRHLEHKLNFPEQQPLQTVSLTFGHEYNPVMQHPKNSNNCENSLQVRQVLSVRAAEGSAVEGSAVAEAQAADWVATEQDWAVAASTGQSNPLKATPLP